MRKKQKEMQDELINEIRRSIAETTPKFMENMITHFASQNGIKISDIGEFNWEWTLGAYQIVGKVKMILICIDDELAEAVVTGINNGPTESIPEMENAYYRNKFRFTELERAVFEKDLEWCAHNMRNVDLMVNTFYQESLIFGKYAST